VSGVPGAPPSPPIATTHWLAVVCAVGAGVAAALNVGKVPVALPPLRAELGLSLVQAGWVSSMLTAVSVLLAAAAGMWVGRLGVLRMVLAGLLLAAASSLAAATFAQGFWALLASRFFEGLGFMFIAVACPALISAASSPTQRRFALGLWSTYMPLGASVALAASPFLLPTLGWRGLWQVTATGLALAALALWTQRIHFGPNAAQVAAQTSFWKPVKAALGHFMPWLLALSFTAWALQHFALIIWMPTYLLEQRHLTRLDAALLTSAMLVACVPGNLVGGWLVQRGLPRGRMLMLAQCCAGLGAAVYSQEGWPDALRYTAAVAVSFAGGVIPAVVMSSSTWLAKTPQQIGTLQGLYTQGAQLGQFVGTPLLAAVVTATGQWQHALFVTGSAAILGVLLGLAVERIEATLEAASQAGSR
jgi:MFS transporter, CP family, cyanate transporter